jgi:hypothetical protein
MKKAADYFQAIFLAVRAFRVVSSTSNISYYLVQLEEVVGAEQRECL